MHNWEKMGILHDGHNISVLSQFDLIKYLDVKVIFTYRNYQDDNDSCRVSDYTASPGNSRRGFSHLQRVIFMGLVNMREQAVTSLFL